MAKDQYPDKVSIWINQEKVNAHMSFNQYFRQPLETEPSFTIPVNATNKDSYDKAYKQLPDWIYFIGSWFKRHGMTEDKRAQYREHEHGPETDKDHWLEVSKQYQLETELDWRPLETIPEDYYS